MHRFFAAVAGLVGLASSLGCAHQSLPKAYTGEARLVLDDEAVDVVSLDSEARRRLTQIDDTCAQRRFVARWAALEDVVGERLLHIEAQSRHQDVASLISQDVDQLIGEPKEAELRGLFAAHKDIIPTSFDEAKQSLRDAWLSERHQALKRALIDRLRRGHNIIMQLTPPKLSRNTIGTHGPSKGLTKAPVTLVVFSDFVCPFSAQARRLLQKLHETYPDVLRIVHRNFVLPQHPEAKLAHEAAFCAGEQERFWPFYDQIFDSDMAVKMSDLERDARNVGLNMEAFAACLKSDRPKQAVARDVLEARSLRLSGTPGIYLNGMQLMGVMPFPVMQAFIDEELKHPYKEAL